MSENIIDIVKKGSHYFLISEQNKLYKLSINFNYPTDSERNQIVEVIEETLDNDVTRNGNALDTQIVDVSTDEGTIYPYGGVRVTARVFYEFTRGSA